MDNTPQKDTEGFAIPAVPVQGVPQDVQSIMEMIGADAGGVEMSVEVEVQPAAGTENALDAKSEDATKTEHASPSTPMTAERHAELLAQLTSFVSGSATTPVNDGEVGYITEDSEEEFSDEEGMEVEPIDLEGLRALMEAKRREEEGTTETVSGKVEEQESSDDEDEDSSDSDSDYDSTDSSDDDAALPARLAQVDMLSDDDEPAPSGPLKTEHEILEEPVGVPPFERLAKGARMVLAGEVVSFVRDPGVAVWEDWRRSEADREEKEKVADVGDVEDATATDAPTEKDADVQEDSKAEQVEAAGKEEGQIEETPAETATAEDQVSIDLVPVAATAAETANEPMASDQVTAEPSEAKPATTEPPLTETASMSAKRPRNRRGGKNRANGPVKTSGPPMPKTSGTVVVQAQRPPAGTVKGGTDRVDEDGWLLDGSVICTGEGQAVAVVAEVFGPTAQPFYLLKLPPPPFPVPSADELARGTKLYYPAEGDHAYVPVRMLKTDKRFKGTDASNLYDEELAEHEMEWSDDEEEQAAKRKLKADRRGKKAGAPVGRQPHFDTASTAGGSDDEMSVHYGGAGDVSVHDDRSEAGFSVASSSARSRRVPQSYGDLYDDQASVGYREPAGRGVARGRGRGAARGASRPVSDRFGDAPPTQAPPRNQDGGRQIGRGAGRGRGGGAERGRGADRGRGRGQSTRGGQQGRDQPRHVAPASANLPARPRDLSPTSAHIARVTGEVVTPAPQQAQQPPIQQQAPYGMMGMSPFGWNPQAGMASGMQMPMPMPMGMGMGGMFPTPFFPMQSQTAQGTGMPGVNPGLMQQYQQVREQYQQMVARYQGHQQPPPGGS